MEDTVETEMGIGERGICIKVIGSGGAGNNTLDTLAELDVRGIDVIAANTDAQDLLTTNADRKIILGKELTRGLGAGNNPTIGEASANESSEALRNAVQGADILFLVGGLGGGTGTGSLPIIASIAQSEQILTVALVTMPFKMEGQRRMDNALAGLKKLEKTVDALVVLPNDKLMLHAQDLSMLEAFKLSDKVSASALRGIIEMITRPGLVNLDFADLRAVLRHAGVATIGLGESNSQNKVVESVMLAIQNPLIESNLRGAQSALINLVGGKDFTLSQAEEALNVVRKSIDEDAKLFWGIQTDEAMNGKMRTMVILTGLKSTAVIDSHAEDGFVSVDEFQD